MLSQYYQFMTIHLKLIYPTYYPFLFIQIIWREPIEFQSTKYQSKSFELDIVYNINLKMSKQAILFVVDAGSTMDDKFIDTESSRFKIALECLTMTLQQKLFNNSSHQIGLTLFGENQADSDDGNSTLLAPITKPNLDFVRKILQCSEIKLESTKVGGDIFKALDYATSHIISHCGTKKYNKRVFLFTNGRGKTQFKNSAINQLVSTIKQNNIKINIIPMDFMETYDLETNQLDSEMFAHVIQQQNSDLILNFKRICPENVQIFPASLAIELYKKFRKRDTNPVALYKGKFQITQGLGIQVCSYKAIRKQRLKSLSKYEIGAPFDPIIRNQKQKDIIQDTVYKIQGTTDDIVVDKDMVINAYNYGDYLVPMNEILQQNTKIFQDKNLTLLGFVESKKVPRHCFLGAVDIVVPQKQDHTNRKLFSAFIFTMIQQKKYALARHVSRNYKNGVTPRMVVLIPYRSPERQMFYLLELPTVEDVRYYPFNSLKQPTNKQRQVVAGLVDKMMLVDNQVEQVKVENMFNPFRQYFYQTIFYRALNQGVQNDIPPLDQITRNYISPQVRIFDKTGPIMSDIKKQFKLNQINLKSQTAKNKNQKTIIWKDLFGSKNQSAQLMSQAQTAENQYNNLSQIGKKFQFQNQNDQKFDHNNPINSFRLMVKNNKKDLVSQALQQFTKYIIKKNGKDSHDFDHLVDCVKELRIACIQEKEVEFWDDWLAKNCNIFSQKLNSQLAKNGLGFINRSNIGMFRVQEVEQMKVAAFDYQDLD